MRSLQAHAFRGFATAIEKDTWDGFIARHADQTLFRDPYAYCGWGVMSNARNWAKSEGFALPIRTVFEDGDHGRGHLERIAKRFRHPKPIFMPKVPRTATEAREVMTPLQAADFAAYEIFKAIQVVHERESAGIRPKMGRRARIIQGSVLGSTDGNEHGRPEDIESTWTTTSVGGLLKIE